MFIHVKSSYLTARNYAHLTQLPPTEPGVHGCDARSIDQMIGPSAEPHQGPRPRTGDVSSSSEAMGMLWTTDEHAHLPYAEDTERKGGARALLGKRSCVSHPLPRGKKCRVSHVLPSPVYS